MSLGVIFLLGLVSCWDQRIRAQTDLPEVYLNPPGDEYLPTVAVTSAISILPFLFLLIFLLCWCWCRAKNRATEDDTKGQVNDNSSSPDMDFQEENQHDVSVDILPEEDRQMDMHIHTEEGPPESSESPAQLRQDPLTGSGDSLPSCTTEDSIK